MKKKTTYELSGVAFESNQPDELQKKHHKNDSLIENEIRQILLRNIDFDSKFLKFKVEDGIIKVEGVVETFNLRNKLHQALKKIDGVVDVINHIVVTDKK